MPEITIIAHRGHGPTSLLSGNGQSVPFHLAPENTLRAFREAIRQGADGIEFDVFITRDGHPVVVHDNELNRNVEGADRRGTELGLISELTLAEVQQHNVGQGEKIPSLREVLDFFVEVNAERARQGKPPLLINLELGKIPGIHKPIAAVVNEYIANGRLSARNIVFCSFEHHQLAALRRNNPTFQISPSIKSATLFGDHNITMPGWQVRDGAVYDPAGIGYLTEFHRQNGCVAMDPVFWDIYQPFVELARREGFGIHASTSDFRSFERQHLLTLMQIADQGIPVVFKTDEPALVRAELARLRAELEQAVGSTSSTKQAKFRGGEQVLERPVRKPTPYSQQQPSAHSQLLATNTPSNPPAHPHPQEPAAEIPTPQVEGAYDFFLDRERLYRFELPLPTSEAIERYLRHKASQGWNLNTAADGGQTHGRPTIAELYRQLATSEYVVGGWKIHVPIASTDVHVVPLTHNGHTLPRTPVDPVAHALCQFCIDHGIERFKTGGHVQEGTGFTMYIGTHEQLQAAMRALTNYHIDGHPLRLPAPPPELRNHDFAFKVPGPDGKPVEIFARWDLNGAKPRTGEEHGQLYSGIGIEGLNMSIEGQLLHKQHLWDPIEIRKALQRRIIGIDHEGWQILFGEHYSGLSGEHAAHQAEFAARLYEHLSGTSNASEHGGPHVPAADPHTTAAPEPHASGNPQPPHSPTPAEPHAGSPPPHPSTAPQHTHAVTTPRSFRLAVESHFHHPTAGQAFGFAGLTHQANHIRQHGATTLDGAALTADAVAMLPNNVGGAAGLVSLGINTARAASEGYARDGARGAAIQGGLQAGNGILAAEIISPAATWGMARSTIDVARATPGAIRALPATISAARSSMTMANAGNALTTARNSMTLANAGTFVAGAGNLAGRAGLANAAVNVTSESVGYLTGENELNTNNWSHTAARTVIAADPISAITFGNASLDRTISSAMGQERTVVENLADIERMRRAQDTAFQARTVAPAFRAPEAPPPANQPRVPRMTDYAHLASMRHQIGRHIQRTTGRAWMIDGKNVITQFDEINWADGGNRTAYMSAINRWAAAREQVVIANTYTAPDLFLSSSTILARDNAQSDVNLSRAAANEFRAFDTAMVAHNRAVQPQVVPGNLPLGAHHQNRSEGSHH